MKQGILLVCGGNYNFGILAINTAVAIKSHSPNMNITLFLDAPSQAAEYIQLILNHDNIEQHELIDNIIEIPSYFKESDNVLYSKIKMNLDYISPYDQTIFIDLDSIIKTTLFLEKSFEYINKNKLFMQLDGFFDKKQSDTIYDNKVTWKQYSKVYDIELSNQIPNVHAYYMGFDKSELSKLFFDECRNYYDDITIKNKHLIHSTWHGSVSDEVVQHIVIMKNSELYNHFKRLEKYLPIHDAGCRYVNPEYESYDCITFPGVWSSDHIMYYEKQNELNYERFNRNRKNKLKLRRLAFNFDNYFDYLFFREWSLKCNFSISI